MKNKLTGGTRWVLLSDDPKPEPEPERSLSPVEQAIRIRLEKRPLGKTVTVVGPLVLTGDERRQLGTHLKKACGRGGTVTETAVELQGDCVAKARDWLTAHGFALA